MFSRRLSVLMRSPRHMTRATRATLNGAHYSEMPRVGSIATNGLVNTLNGNHPNILESMLDPMFFPASDLSKTLRKEKSLADVKIGFIGWGSMAQAISLGLLKKDATFPEGIRVTGRRQEILDKAQQEGIEGSLCNKEVAEWADIVVIAVKPQVVSTVMPEIASVWNKDKVMVSVCAGVTIDTFQEALGKDAKIVRTMPNTPCLVGEAATAYAGNSNCEDWELDLVEKMFSSVGNATHRVAENLLNAVTGVSGSGPAYVYMMIQAMSDAGVHAGLPRDVALGLAAQTVMGAAKMVQESGKHPSVLKEAVTSPAGTTIAGVKALEDANFNAAVMGAVNAAKTRADELAEKSKSSKPSRTRSSRGVGAGVRRRRA
eukprot:TRINITY_DN64638_c0_g1_i1.p1 TRINITY_DN64638_c0_g1~~TRINITY_DN64638_c0_g1_i1.p1  ORF type:complete len:397 (-),score=73.07 TRINITY_DN64638_c0_g1_i1:176-1294(-)